MHATRSPVANPFGLMMNPQSILEAVERSERLSGLQRRICRPLDKPIIPRLGTAEADAALEEAFDDEVPEDFGLEAGGAR